LHCSPEIDMLALPRAQRAHATARLALLGLTLGLLVAPTTWPRAQTPALGATLDGLLVFARERHPELQAMRHEAAAAAARITTAGSLPDPMLQVELRDLTNASSGGSFNVLPGRVGSTRYQLRQTFPAWGKRDARRDVATAAADEAQRRTDVTWAELAMRIKSAYARYRQASESLAQTRAVLDLVDRLEAVAQVRYAGGLAPQQDAIRAQLERTATSADIVQLESDLRSARVRINGLLVRPADAPLAEPVADDGALPAPARLDPAALRERLLARNPQLAAEEARIRAAERNKDAVWANRYPEFTFGVAPIQMRNRIGEWEVMFEINIPLRQDSRRADEREALSMLAAAQSRREALQGEALTSLGESIAALDAAHRIETLTRTSLLPQAELTLQAALAGYESGKADFSTVLEAQRQIRQAQLTLIRTHADARMRRAEIERLLGDEL
jgi:outer membrane protein TolC